MRAKRQALMLTLSLLLIWAPALKAQGGHFELSGHYGRWSLNLLGSTAEKLINDTIDTELRDRILETIQGDHPNLTLTAYDQSVTFDSSGDDFGASFRWYPGGHHGSFSLGVSIEKSTFKIQPLAAARMDLQDQGTLETATFQGTASASAIIKATSFLVTFRWDIIPRAVIHPYLTFGGGISTSKALDDSSVAFAYTGQLSGGSIPTETVEGSESKTLRELRDEALADEENDFPVPNFIPFLQLNLGLKVRLMKSVHLFVDAGVFDGFMASAGIALRI
ncbi:MAG TPA: hypothetical protein VLJ16_14275 [Acidobacteriota bacterium]|nr:hypothetical protein [Acidobacteriota bacterium]